MEVEYLREKLAEWIYFKGRLPKKDEMNTKDGFPSSNQYFKVLGLNRWNDVLKHFGYISEVRFWTTDEKSYLKENWKNYLDSEIAKVLNRSIEGVRAMRIN